MTILYYVYEKIGIRRRNIFWKLYFHIYIKNQNTNVKEVGKTLSLLTLLVAKSKYLAERISKEKGVSWKEAENIVIDWIKDGMKTANV